MSQSEYFHEAARLQSFRTSKIIKKRRYTWRFKLIPPEYLAKLGFYFDPKPNKVDSISCVYCHRNTSGVREARAKSRDTLETICNVLMLHIGSKDTFCLLSYLKLKLIRDAMFSAGKSDWANDRFLRDPFGRHVIRMLRQVYMNRDQEDWGTDKLIYSGLVPYNSSFTAFKELVPENVDDAAGNRCYFCFYCKGLIEYKESVHPIIAHFTDCNPGCYFFEYVKLKLGLSEALTEEILLEFCKNTVLDDDLEEDRKSDSPGQHQESPIDLSSEQDGNDKLGISSSPPSIIPSPIKDTGGELYDDSNDSGNANDLRNSNSVPFKRRLPENVSSPQSRKRIKLTRSSPQRISLNSSTDDTSNLTIQRKAVTVDLKKYVERKKDTTIKPNLLLDSDESASSKGGAFSFSNQGTSHFELDVSPIKSQDGATKSLKGAEVVDNNPKFSQNLNISERTKLTHNSSMSPPQTSPEFFTALSRQTAMFHPKSPANVSPSNDLEMWQSSTPIVHKLNWATEPEAHEINESKYLPALNEKRSSSSRLDKLPTIPQLLPSSPTVESVQTGSSDASSLSSSSSSSVASPQYERQKPTAAARPHLGGTDGLGISNLDINQRKSVPKLSNDIPFFGSDPPNLGPPDRTDIIITNGADHEGEIEHSVEVQGGTKDELTGEPPPHDNIPILKAEPSQSQQNLTHPITQDNISNIKDEIPANDSERNSLLRRLTINDYAGIDSARDLVKKYFHDLLEYINEHDATLDNDLNGDLRFLINKMPDRELDMTFEEWLQDKVDKIHEEFISSSVAKLQLLKREFNEVKDRVTKIDGTNSSDDEWLVSMAKKFGIH